MQDEHGKQAHLRAWNVPIAHICGGLCESSAKPWTGAESDSTTWASRASSSSSASSTSAAVRVRERAILELLVLALPCNLGRQGRQGAHRHGQGQASLVVRPRSGAVRLHVAPAHLR